MELQEFVTQSGDVVNELFDLTEFDRDLPEQPVVSGSLDLEHILHLVGPHHPNPDQKLADLLTHISIPLEFHRRGPAAVFPTLWSHSFRATRIP